ncbi:hypothetical protein [Denitromonas sp.]|nr:hypothetical protein [Denitromonas sp.]
MNITHLRYHKRQFAATHNQAYFVPLTLSIKNQSVANKAQRL